MTSIGQPGAGQGDSELLPVQLSAESGSLLEKLARSLHTRADLPATLSAILHNAVEIFAGAQAAGVNLLVRGQFRPQAVLGSAPPVLDAAQGRAGTGPCIDASREQQPIFVPDMAHEPRWGGFPELAVAQGVCAMGCVPLWVDELQLGSLSLYFVAPREFDEQFVRTASLLATHAALALAAAGQAENLAVALQSRDVIGQAKGILMERYRLTAQQAFDLLSARSQQTNRKLRELAEQLAVTGQFDR